MNYPYRTTIIALVTAAALSTILLIGARFGFTWAGGEGFSGQRDIEVNGSVFQRGETISTLENFLSFEVGSVKVWMDKNTQVKLVDTSGDAPILNIVQGRIVIKGSAMITVREIKTRVDGTTSFVHYSWLDEIEIGAFDGMVEISRPGHAFELKNDAVRIQTLPPYESTGVKFDPEQSSAADFYEYALKNR